jgi:predicted DNA-binding ArsR family transcriptional regulator
MTDVAETVTSSKQTVVTASVEKKYITFEATVSVGNTITLSDLTDILYVKACKKSDGSDVTCTEATNVVTITESPLSSVAIVGFAYGT